jgi:hypothetical protein
VHVLLLGDGQQFDLVGPGIFTINTDGPHASSGGRVVKSEALADALRYVRLRPSRIAQASITMRGDPLPTSLDLTFPVGTRLLDEHPHFTWTPIPAATGYVFQLMDSNGGSVYETRTPSARIELPSSVRLLPGESYAWLVQAVIAGGREVGAWAEFGIADSELRKRIDSARPPANADFSQRLLFALFLDQQDLKEEAHRAWHVLALERPDEKRLRALAAER